MCKTNKKTSNTHLFGFTTCGAACYARGDAKPGLIKAFVMQGLMFSGSLDWLNTHKQQMMKNKAPNTQKQNHEILFWFSDDDDQCLYQRSYTHDRCTMPSRNCTYGFLAESMIAPQSLSLQRSKDMLSCFLHGVKLSLYRALNYLNGYILITRLIKEHVLITRLIRRLNRKQK